MGLTAAQREQRAGKLTASAVGVLMNGTPDRILNLWRELVGDPDYVEEDLSDVWPVQLGAHTESLNLDWFSRKHGPVIRRGEVVVHPVYDWAACTLDGWSTTHSCAVEAKHVGGFEHQSVIIGRYQPQLHWQMLCTETSKAALSTIRGAAEPIVDFVDFDDDYAAELMRRAETFMAFVWSVTPPLEVPAVPAPVKAERIVYMGGSNEWGDSAATWLETTAARKRNEKAEKHLKSMVPADAARAHGAGVVIARDRAGRLSIREHQS